MVEHVHQRRNVCVKHRAVYIPEGLPERVAPVVSLEVHFPAPGLDQAVQVRHGKCLVPLPGRKKHLLIAGVRHGRQERLQGLLDVSVDGHIPELASFLFANQKVVASLQVPHLAHGDMEKIPGPEICVNSQSEDGEVPGTFGEQPLDEPDVLRVADRLDLDRGALLWPVVREHFHSQ